MKTSRHLLIPFLLFAAIVFSSCQRPGTGGKFDLNVYVKHHHELIFGVVVYIKYGAKEFPGHNSSNYDASYTAGTEGNEKGFVKISGLRKGFYYLYSVGFDAAINMSVEGGVPVEIKEKSGEMEITVPVTEEH